jgi:hypothetical protein
MGSTGRPQRDIDADVRRLIQVVWPFPLEAGTLFDATRVEDVRFTRVPLGARRAPKRLAGWADRRSALVGTAIYRSSFSSTKECI